MKRLVVEDSFWELYPTAQIAFAVGCDMKTASEVSPEDAAEIAALLEEASALAKNRYQDEIFATIPEIAIWRQAFSKFKRKKGARSTVENLIKRAIKGNPVPSIEPLVDISNTIGIKYAMPVGAEVIDAIEGDLHLGVDLEGGKEYIGIGSDKNDPTLPGEVCYWDDCGAISRCWNWRDAQRIMVGSETRASTLSIENLDPTRAKELEAAFQEFCDLAERYLDAKIVSCDIATKDHPAIPLGR